jgi:tRNA1Val (adenine37-N6)-methyltransferase
MSNSWFQFRAFRIEQDKCAMKVTTDACIQGAWTPIPGGAKSVLDIGSGTGLLSLMLAQRNSGLQIDAVEYDKDAAIQASHNIAASAWEDRIKVLHADIRTHAAVEKYDLIICNPPFFDNSLLSDKTQKNLARHNVSLSKEELAEAIANNLAEGGYVSVLLPYTEYKLWETTAATFGLSATEVLYVRHKPGAAIKRVVGIMSLNNTAACTTQELIIKDENNEYTEHFRTLLRPFYLDL